MAEFYKYDPAQLAGRPLVNGLTIDDRSTRDIDDAIHIEYRDSIPFISVSIADVATSVAAGTGDDLEAYSRAYTSYFRSSNVPMLPRSFSEDRLSLVERVERPTLTVSMSLDSQREPANVTIKRTIFKNPKKVDYAEFTNAINSGDRMAGEWYDVATKLLEKRRVDGALYIYDLHEGISFDEDGKIIPFRESEHQAQIVVQEIMVLANKAIAQFSREHNIPILFRNHRGDREIVVNKAEMLERLEKARREGDVSVIQQMRRELQRQIGAAQYHPDCEGHFGLSVSAYCHFTSPIRRYADLINHRQILAYMDKGIFPYSKDDLLRMSAHLNDRADIERERRHAAAKGDSFRASAEAIEKASSEATSKPLTRRNILDGLRIYSRNQNIDDALKAAVLQSIADQIITNEELFVIIVRAPKNSESWREVREAAISHIREKDGVAVSMLMETLTKHGDEWKKAIFSDGDKPGGFFSTLNVQIGQNSFHLEGPPKAQKRLARSAAAIGFWERVHNDSLVSNVIMQEDVPDISSPAEAPRSSALRISTVGKNSSGIINEFCQASHLTMPVERFTTKGTSHNPTFSCALSLTLSDDDKLEAQGVGKTKRQAKDSAASRMIENMQERRLIELIS